MIKRILIIILLTLILPGCGQTTPGPAPLPTPGGKWTVRMTHSGGIMGIDRTIQVTSAGSATVIDQRTDQKVMLQLENDELFRLDSLVRSARLKPIPDSIPGCADCFIYDIEIQTGSTAPFTIQLNDISLPDSGLEPLVTFLRNLMEQAVSG
jgi:hypothetical protein